jgi:hypothetical protein
MLRPLPSTFASTRDGLHALACFAIGPARKARDGHIGLRPTGDGFGTPPFTDGTRITVQGDRLRFGTAGGEAITTVRAAATVLGIEPSPDPGVGHDLPPYAPDAPLAVDPGASFALGAWYAFAADVLAAATVKLLATSESTVSDQQIWPEHFDLACDWGRDDIARLNLGGSPGDAYSPVPYLYAGPWERDALAGGDPFWNAPFGAVVTYDELLAIDDPFAAAVEHLVEAANHLPH